MCALRHERCDGLLWRLLESFDPLRIRVMKSWLHVRVVEPGVCGGQHCVARLLLFGKTLLVRHCEDLFLVVKMRSFIGRWGPGLTGGAAYPLIAL